VHAEVTLLDLRLRRRLLLGYLLGMAFYTLVIVVLYPQFKDAASLDQFGGSTAAALFGVTGQLTSPEGWLDGNIYQNFLPLIMLLIAIGYGASSVAGQDEDGTLSLATTLPLSRRSVLLQKVLTLTFQVVGLALLTMLCVVAGRSFELPISLVHLAGISAGAALLGLDFGLLALALGAWTGSRGLALGIAAALAAASYLVSSLAPVVPWIRPARYASLFYWAIGNGQLERGLSAASAVVLLIVAMLLLGLAILAFDRLDLH
jgi:beta-exotoxin I transport system permease protein